MGNLLRIQKKPAHTFNCDGVLPVLSALLPRMKSCFIPTGVINSGNQIYESGKSLIRMFPLTKARRSLRRHTGRLTSFNGLSRFSFGAVASSSAPHRSIC